MKAMILINFVDRAHITPPVLAAVEDVLREARVEFSTVRFTSRRHSEEAISEAAEKGFDTIFLGGGDGTVHNLFNIAFHRNFTFGILPLGTVNALARSLGLPHDPVEAVRAALGGRPCSLDVGRAAGRWFNCFLSIGFDASVVCTLDEKTKVRWGRAAFAVQGLKRLACMKELPRFAARFFPSGFEAQGQSLLVSNIANYAGFRLFPGQMNDGIMDSVLFTRNGPLPLFAGIGGMFCSRKKTASATGSIIREPLRRVDVRSTAPLFVQMDGDAVILPAPAQELSVEVHPGAARFLAPR